MIGSIEKKIRHKGLCKRVLTVVLMILLFPFYLILVLLKIPFLKNGAADWEKEKNDILKRRNWTLIKGGWLFGDKTYSSGHTLLKAMPTILGKHYGTEWAIYTCSHMAAAGLSSSPICCSQLLH